MTEQGYIPEIQEVISSGKVLNVLVVDDTKSIRSAIREVLELGNLQVTEADCGNDALKIIADKQPDLVLLDMDMSGMNGISILKTLRQTCSKLELPIIMMAAAGPASEMIYALDCGANDYITRPVDYDVLWARLSNQLMQKQAAEYLRSAQIRLENLVRQRTAELDISNRELKKEIEVRLNAEDQLRKQANYDELTGLPNRNLASDRLHQMLAKAKRHKLQPCLAFLDLDNFKYVNDTFGHPAGDCLLKEVAARLLSCARESDTVARLGGDEFLLILDDNAGNERQRPLEIRRIGERIIESLATPFNIEGHELKITPSLGFAIYPDDGNDTDTLMRHADMAMYRSKHDGKNRYCFYSPDMSVHSQMRLDVETRLHHALDRDEFSIVYQPIVSPRSGKIIKAEALLRWNSNDLGMLSPGYFIPIAEEIGVIIPVGEWVINSVCNQVSQWRKLGYHDFAITINVSATQFRPESRLVETINNALSVNHLPADAIQLELTEGVLLKETKHSATTMQRLQSKGIKLLIDDFGTGYASLTYLQRYNFESIKIDRSYISNVLTSEQDAKLVRGIIAMAKQMEMSVVSEGVENKEQLDLLIDANCELIQGYFFSRPLPANDFLTLLEKTNRHIKRFQVNKPVPVYGA